MVASAVRPRGDWALVPSDRVSHLFYDYIDAPEYGVDIEEWAVNVMCECGQTVYVTEEDYTLCTGCTRAYRSLKPNIAEVCHATP